MTKEKPTTAVSIAPLDALVEHTLRAVNDVDADLAAQRVADLRTQRSLHGDALVEHLIRQKARQTGMVGAVTSAAALVPGLGNITAFTIGVAADVGVTLRLQSELVLEIAAARGKTLSPSEARNALLVVTGLNMGAERLVNQAGRKLAQKTAERFAGRAIVKAIPFVGIAVSAGANMVMTYLVGRRADAYFQLGEDQVGDWNASLRALTGVDERKLVGWLGEVMTEVGAAIGNRARQLRARAGDGLRSASNAVVARFGRRPRSDV
jgi:uncharacterized protein (DUF697 family)